MRRIVGVGLACLLGGCGGGASGTAALPVAHASPLAKTGTLSLKIVIPSAAAVATARTAALKRIYSAASSTQGILFTIYPHGGNPATQAIVVSGNDISGDAGSSCTTTGTTRTCTIAIAAPAVSTNDLLAQTYDQIIPPSGTLPAGADLLSAGTVADVPVVAGTSSTVSLTLNPVLATVTLAPTPAQVHTLLPTTLNLAVYGYDAGGNIILAGSYADQNGNPVSITLATPTNPNNSMSLSATSVPGSGASVTLSYNGTANTAGSLQVQSSAPYAATGSISLVAPSVAQLSDPNLSGTPTGYNGIAYANNGGAQQVFYTTQANHGLSYYTGTGSLIFIAPQAAPTSLPFTGGVAADSGQNLVFIGGPVTITQVPTLGGGSVGPQVAATCSPLANCGTTGGIAYDPTSGNLYYGANNTIYSFTPSSSATALGTPTFAGTANFGGFSFDSVTSNLWFTDFETGGYLYEYTGTFYSNQGSPTTHAIFDVVANGGDAYVTDPGDGKVYTYSDPRNAPIHSISTTGTPQYIIKSGFDSSIWFTETNAAGLMLGRYDLTSQKVGELTVTSLVGGTAGPIVQIPGTDEFAVVHYSGSGSPGELLLVQP